MVGWMIELLEWTLSRNLPQLGVASDSGKEWTLSVDKASNQKGSGAGGTQEGLDEYEALLVGMRLVEELGTQVPTPKSDSQLVVG
ncbi:hypothetical protein CR513_44889, partial [Mucuna pruriens]